MGAQVDRLLDRPLGRRVAEAAKGAGGNLVGINQLGVDLYVGILVAGVMAHRRDTGDGRRFGRVRAVVGDHSQLFGADAAVFLEAHLDVDLHKDARPAAGEKFFFAAIDQFYRFARLFGEHSCYQRVVVVAGFAAESAAHRALDYAHIGFRHAQRCGDSQARAKQRLGIHVDRVFAVRSVFGDAADGFDGTVPLWHARKSILYDHVGVGESLGDIAALDLHGHRDIIRLVIVHQRRAVFDRFLGVENTRERLPIDFNEIDRFFGDVGIDGRDGGDFLADVARFPDREYVLIGEEGSPGTLDGVFGSHYSAHAAKLRRFACVDVANPRMRVGAS